LNAVPADGWGRYRQGHVVGWRGSEEWLGLGWLQGHLYGHECRSEGRRSRPVFVHDVLGGEHEVQEQDTQTDQTPSSCPQRVGVRQGEQIGFVRKRGCAEDDDTPGKVQHANSYEWKVLVFLAGARGRLKT